jgi:FixJ family two-component response regulator
VDARSPIVRQATVLLVDDDPAVLRAVSFALESEGIAVRSFATPSEAIGGIRFDATEILVIDYRLPEMNGLDLIRALRDRGASGLAMLITSQPGPALREAAADCGVLIIEKPLIDDRLIKAIRTGSPN